MSTPAILQSYALRSGAKMPALGFGTWQAPPGLVAKSVDVAIASGMRHIDCAAVYGNEAEIGAKFTEIFKAGAVKREDLFITSKLWNNAHHPEDVEAACRRTLKDLQLEYLDLYLIHWPIAFQRGPVRIPADEKTGGTHQADVPIVDTWKAMEKLVDAGLVRNIGVCNYNEAQLRETFEAARIKPACHQIEVQPALANDEIRAVNKELGIVTTGYCPLGVGIFGARDVFTFKEPEFVAIAEKHNVGSASLALQWNLQSGNVVLTKSLAPARIAENAATPIGALSAEAMAEVDAYGATVSKRVCNPGMFFATAGPFFAPH